MINTRTSNPERGDIAVYIALLLSGIMLSFVLLMSFVLSRQLRLTEDVVWSERALYAADTGLEHSLYIISKQLGREVEVNGGEISFSLFGGGESSTPYQGLEYEGETGGVTVADYEGQAAADEAGIVCALIEGSYRDQKRRLALGPPDCELP